MACSLVEGKLPVGKHTIERNAQNFPAGIYLYRIKVNDFSTSGRLVISEQKSRPISFGCILEQHLKSYNPFRNWSEIRGDKEIFERISVFENNSKVNLLFI